MSDPFEIGRWAWAQDVAGLDLLVLLCLAKHADWDTLECYPSQPYVAKQCGISERTVRKVLSNLEEVGVIIRTPRSGSSDIITLNAPALRATPADSVRAPRQTVPVTPANRAGKQTQEPIKENNARESRSTDLFEDENSTPPQAPPTPPIEPQFSRFWQAYPSKVGREAARKAFAKAIPKIPWSGNGAPVDRMILAIDEQRRSKRWLDGYVPNPATWLNQGRWDDVLPPAAGAQRSSGLADF